MTTNTSGRIVLHDATTAAISVNVIAGALALRSTGLFCSKGRN